ncbi:MAG: hypothetical protein PHH82_00100 [Candidatus ainarchaeum sp.]|nr:hypothetical protein [Candidatus ainarchaeum sp.]
MHKLLRKYKYQFLYKDTNSYFKFFKSEKIDLLFMACIAFFVPIFFSKITFFPNQLLIGTVVNAALAYCALNYEYKKILPVILLPAFGTMISGIVFGPLSIYLIYLMPFIWASNFLFVYIIRTFKVLKSKNYFLTVFLGGTAKSALLFVVTILFVTFSIVPQAMLLPMSLIQLITALSGGFLAGVYYIVK